MIDYARIKVIAGNGGHGAGSFEHVKGKRRGKPDGGDGGRGGNVYFAASADLNTLEPFRYVKEYKAAGGGNGLSRKRKGADGEDLAIKVPAGTTVKVMSPSQGLVRPWRKSDESEVSTLHYDFDLVAESQRVLVARGGEGGRGNSHLKDEFGRRPKAGEMGEEGETFQVTLELKLIADVGLIGLPNAGKSTLLSALTSAKPKIANYPFTTLEPNLGVLEVKVISQSDKSTRKNSLYTPDLDYRLIIADIPGLIEGASEGKGLGDLFLRHIERTRVLVHLVDVSDSSNVWDTYQTVRHELKNYSKELVKKKEIIVLNKIDVVTQDNLLKYIDIFKGHRKKVLVISATTGAGLRVLVREIYSKV